MGWGDGMARVGVIVRVRRRLPKRVRRIGLTLLRAMGLWSRPPSVDQSRHVPPQAQAQAPSSQVVSPPAGVAAGSALRRVFDLVVPIPSRDPAAGLELSRTLHFDTPAGMYVPEVLESRTLAGYEPYALAAFLAAVEQAPSGQVLDIGANVGLYALLAAMISDRPVCAVEPTPDLAQAARDLAQLNGLDISVEELALGDSSGTATLYLSDRTDSSNSLNPNFRRHSREIEVELRTVDEHVERTGQVPAIMKIDTETTEPQVITGAFRTIAEHRPWIFVELLVNRSEQELREAIAPHGYTPYHLSGPGPRPVLELLAGDPTGVHLMYLLAPAPVEPGFWERMNAWQAALEHGCAARDGGTEVATAAGEASA